MKVVEKAIRLTSAVGRASATGCWASRGRGYCGRGAFGRDEVGRRARAASSMVELSAEDMQNPRIVRIAYASARDSVKRADEVAEAERKRADYIVEAERMRADAAAKSANRIVEAERQRSKIEKQYFTEKLLRLTAERLRDLQKLHARGLVEQQVVLACLDVNSYRKKLFQSELHDKAVRKLSFRNKMELLSAAYDDVKQAGCMERSECGMYFEALESAFDKCSRLKESFSEFYMSMWTSFSADIHDVVLDGETINIYRLEARHKCALRELARKYGVRVVEMAVDSVDKALENVSGDEGGADGGE